MVLLWSFADIRREAKKLSVIACVHNWGEKGKALPFRFSSHTRNKWLFHNTFSSTFFFFLLSWLIKIAPCAVLKCGLVFLRPRRLWCAYRENVCQIHSDMSYSADGQYISLCMCVWVCHLACWCVSVSVYWDSESRGRQLVCHPGPCCFCCCCCCC